MSVVHAVASATPVATPVVQAAQAVVVTHAAVTTNAVTDFLNSLASKVSQADILVAAGTISSFLVGLLNKSKFLQHEVAVVQDARRFTVAVILPFLGTYIATLSTGHNDLGVAPIIFVVSQVVFYAVKFFRTAPVLADTPLATETPAVG